MMENINIKEGYSADMNSMYSSKGYFYPKTKGLSSNTRCDDGLENMIKEYAEKSSTTRAWTNKAEFDSKLKEAKSFKKVLNKKAVAEAKRLLNKS